MCGRYAVYEPDEISERFDVEDDIDLNPNYNAAPTQTMPVITHAEKNELVLMRWGIPRTIGKDLTKDIFNTRGDKALGPFWKKTVTANRCLVPANGFYEWMKTADGKIPYLIQPKEEGLFAFAGIWSEWKKDDEVVQTFSIMTTDPNEEMKAIHNRMPVILRKEDEALWLSESIDLNDIEELLLPSDDGLLKMHEVSKAVNNARTNEAGLLGPVNTK